MPQPPLLLVNKQASVLVPLVFAKERCACTTLTKLCIAHASLGKLFKCKDFPLQHVACKITGQHQSNVNSFLALWIETDLA